MGLVMITVLEIFTNPWDLIFFIGPRDGKWGFTITRGPGHNGKILVITKGFAETKEVAVEALKELLESISTDCTRQYKDPESFISQFLNPDKLEIDESVALNMGLVAQIVDELTRCNEVRTYEFAPAS